MKIQNDLRSQVQGRPMARQTVHTVNASASNGVGSPDSLPLLNYRSMTNAMVMIQKAQSIVQEALSVSGRLHSIAAESMMTGRTDMQAVTRELAGIDNSLGQYGAATASPPVQPDAVPAERMKEIKAAVGEMHRMAGNGAVDGERLKEIQSTLKESEKIFKHEFGTVSAKAMNTDPFRNSFSQHTFNSLKSDITGNANIALGAQGNLIAANVNYLAG